MIEKLDRLRSTMAVNVLSSQSVSCSNSYKTYTIRLLFLVTYILQEKKQRQNFTGHWHRSGRSEANYLEWLVKEHLIAGSNKKVLRWEVKEEWLTHAERWTRTGSNARSS